MTVRIACALLMLLLLTPPAAAQRIAPSRFGSDEVRTSIPALTIPAPESRCRFSQATHAGLGGIIGGFLLSGVVLGYEIAKAWPDFPAGDPPVVEAAVVGTAVGAVVGAKRWRRVCAPAG